MGRRRSQQQTAGRQGWRGSSVRSHRFQASHRRQPQATDGRELPRKRRRRGTTERRDVPGIGDIEETRGDRSQQRCCQGMTLSLCHQSYVKQSPAEQPPDQQAPDEITYISVHRGHYRKTPEVMLCRIVSNQTECMMKTGVCRQAEARYSPKLGTVSLCAG